MKTLFALMCCALLSIGAHAAPFAKGDPQSGKALHDKSCVNCHAGILGGDGSKMYTRSDRKAKTAQQLAARISACNSNVGTGWFPEEEAHVGAYLNREFYHYK